MQKCFLLTVRGLEGVCAAEAAELPGVNVQKIEYRRIMLETARPEHLLQLRTADDAFLFLGSLNGLDKQRSGLAQLAGWCRTLAFQPAACFLGKPGLGSVAPVFSVSASFVGKRNYTSEEIKQAVAVVISDLTGWQYGREDEGGVHLRLFIDHEQVWAGLRIAEKAMHARAWKRAERPGALRPTVAAAMLRLGEPWSGARVLDPFCGSGTIAVEAALIGLSAAGFDVQWEAVRAAWVNASSGGVKAGLSRTDSLRMPVTDRSIDFIVSNLPWGRQVETPLPLDEFYRLACTEMERVHHPSGKIVLLTGHPELVGFHHLNLQRSLEISLYGQTPSILIYARG